MIIIRIYMDKPERRCHLRVSLSPPTAKARSPALKRPAALSWPSLRVFERFSSLARDMGERFGPDIGEDAAAATPAIEGSNGQIAFLS